MLPIILSLGAVYAFIPVIIIIVLIIAASGSVGRDFFELFGFASIVGWAAGIGGGGAGKGISKSRQYRPAADRRGTYDTTKRGEAILDTTGRAKNAREIVWKKGTPGSLYMKGAVAQKNQADKERILAYKMKPNDIREMLNHYGLGGKSKGIPDSDVAGFAAGSLSLPQVGNYYARYVATKPAEGMPPLRGPTGASNPAGVRMSVEDFYRTYFGARKGKIRSGSTKLAVDRTQAKKTNSSSETGEPSDNDRLKVQTLANAQMIKSLKTERRGKVNQMKKDHQAERDALEKAHEKEIDDLRKQQKSRLDELRSGSPSGSKDAEMGKLKKQNGKEMNDIEKRHSGEVSQMKKQQKDDMNSLKESYSNREAQFRDKPSKQTSIGDRGSGKKLGMLSTMTPDELQKLCSSYGLKPINTNDKGKLAEYADKNLSAEQIAKFKKDYLDG